MAAAAAAPRRTPRPTKVPRWPAREPSKLSVRRRGPLLRAARPAPQAGRWARAGRRAQPMGERCADNAPGPARCRRASLAGRAGAGGGGGRGGRTGGGGAEAIETKSVLRAPARAPLGAGDTPGVRRSRTVGLGSGAHTLTGASEARKPPGVCDACQLGGTGGALAPHWAQEPGTRVQIPSPPPSLGVLACIIGTLPR